MDCGWSELYEQMLDWLVLLAHQERGKAVVQLHLILIDRLLLLQYQR